MVVSRPRFWPRSHSIGSQSRSHEVLVSVSCELVSWSLIDHWLLNWLLSKLFS